MKSYYLLRETSENETLGLYGTKNEALFALGRHSGQDLYQAHYSKLCKALREGNIYSLYVNGKDYVVVAYPLNQDQF